MKISRNKNIKNEKKYRSDLPLLKNQRIKFPARIMLPPAGARISRARNSSFIKHRDVVVKPGPINIQKTLDCITDVVARCVLHYRR